MNLNKATIIGNLTRDPEIKTMESGVSVATFSVATNRVWKKDGEKKESVEFHNVVVFGKLADNCAQFLKKGSHVLVDGRLQTRSWEGDDGTKHYRTEIVAHVVQFGSRKRAEDPKEEQSQPDKGFEYPEEEINPDDIPF